MNPLCFQHIKNFVTGALVENFKATGQVIGDSHFDRYAHESAEVVFGYLNGNKTLDGTCSDFQCTIALEAKKVFKSSMSASDKVVGSHIYHSNTGEVSNKKPPVLVEMTQIRVGDFLVFTNGSGELFVQPTDHTGSKTTSQPFRCQSSQSGLKIAAKHIDIVPYGGSTGILLSN